MQPVKIQSLCVQQQPSKFTAHRPLTGQKVETVQFTEAVYDIEDAFTPLPKCTGSDCVTVQTHTNIP